jgi:hypothetical protein
MPEACVPFIKAGLLRWRTTRNGKGKATHSKKHSKPVIGHAFCMFLNSSSVQALGFYETEVYMYNNERVIAVQSL